MSVSVERRMRPPEGRRDRAAGARLWPLALAASAFTVAQLVFVSSRMGLGWDETVYVSQVSPHAPAAFFSAPRARGISLLVAPVAGLTSSTAALRCYLAVLSGAGLFLALSAWRGLRPTRVLALAGALFAGLWVTQFYGPQAMPNLWVALGGLAAVGFFLRLAASPPGSPVIASSPEGGASAIGVGAGLAGSVAFVALLRPGDAVWLTIPLVAAVPFAAVGRRWPLLAAMAGGTVAGGAEWVAEAYARYGGVTARLRDASRVEGGFGWHLAVVDQIRTLNGRALCRPCDVPWRHPVTSLWWLTLPVFAAAGVVVAARTGRQGRRPEERGRPGRRGPARRADALVPALCALTVATPYLFLIDYAAPRFLLPAYALLAVPVADVLTWSLARPRAHRRRAAMAGLIAVCLAGHQAIQQMVLVRTVARTRTDHDDYARVAANLHRLGVRPPCLLTGDLAIPIAYYARCASAQIAGNNADTTAAGIVAATRERRVAVLVAPRRRPPSYARVWTAEPLSGRSSLRGYRAYLPRR
jgi:hypothetical protein